LLSTPSLGITEDSVLLNIYHYLTFNSLSRDHGESEKQIIKLDEKETFNSLSRDHGESEKQIIKLDEKETFNSLSRDH